MRILNADQLVSHGNIKGRQHMLQILEAGLAAADPYQNALKLIHIKDNILYIGNSDFEADNDPQSGIEKYDLNEIKRIYVVGAGKGVQRAARAFEEVLGDRLTGGEVICKYGDEPILKQINVTYGAHPVPDDNCVAGSRRILQLSEGITENDLVITMIANGGSSLLTLPFDDIPLEDVKRIVRIIQIEKGVSTTELNAIRNHIDQLKGGRIARIFSPARMVHIIVADANNHDLLGSRDYEYLVRQNRWLHNLPEGSAFSDAIAVLKHHDAWDICPSSIRQCLMQADLKRETVKYDEFHQMRFRIFGIMPMKYHFLKAARQKAAELGYRVGILSEKIQYEASQMGYYAGSIASNIEKNNEPFNPPVALFTTGEMRVTVDQYQGIGGRNQEFALASATVIKGCDNVVIASVDTDGTDGPGGLNLRGAPKCLSGGIVDGYTADEAERQGIDITTALKEHNVSEALWKLECGISAEQNISLNDLTVILVGATGAGV